MKKLIMATLIAATLATSVNAQPPAPEGPGKQPAAGRDREKGMRPPVDQPLQPVTAYQGKAVKMSTNNDYVYDGFYMLSGSDSLLVKFPPHLGKQVTAAVKTGSSVSVNGALRTTPFEVKEIKMVSITANGQTISDMPPATTTTPPLETFVKSTGKITSLQTDREGRTNGFILDNKTILHIAPQVAAQLGTMASNGTGIAYTGMQKTARQGEVSAANYTIVHCNTITVNGQQYLVEGPGGRR